METLKLVNLNRNFGALQVLNQVTLEVRNGERRGIIGPNGAGKTTLFNIISGELPPTSGTVFFRGMDITGFPPHERCALGMARTYQISSLFGGLTVFENVRLAVQARQRVGGSFFAPPARLSSITEAVEEILERLGLLDERHIPARNLSYGKQRQLEIAVAVATHPQVLLLDEPTAGMSPAETWRMVELIAGFPKDMTIMVIEHDMDAVFAIADRLTVLHNGEVLADGEPDRVKADPRVLDVYLGTGSQG